ANAVKTVVAQAPSLLTFPTSRLSQPRSKCARATAPPAAKAPPELQAAEVVLLAKMILSDTKTEKATKSPRNIAVLLQKPAKTAKLAPKESPANTDKMVPSALSCPTPNS